MRMSEPFFREAGTGPAVVCIHANAGSSSQWRALMDRLSPRYRVLAPDTHGAGKGPPWPADRALTLSDEVAALAPVLAQAGEAFTLIGHSYGGAIALMAAASYPQSVRALVLYEPTLFALVDAQTPPPNDADGIRNTVARATAALLAGDRPLAAETFIDFWTGVGSWREKPEAQREAIAAACVNVPGWGHALLNEPTPLAAFAALKMPVLLLMGSQTQDSARAVATLLARTWPHAEFGELDGMGHMGPLTHPDIVNAAIEEFLHRHGGPA
jgi:pimeloyl-ACP methyl ester carboxylesterase